MLFEDAVFTQRRKENTLFQKRMHACIIDMLYYLLYVKIYENTFYNIVRAKFEIKTKSQAYILPQLRITVHSLFFLGKERRHLSHFPCSYTFGVPLSPSECTYFLNGPIVHTDFIIDFDIL